MRATRTGKDRGGLVGVESRSVLACSLLALMLVGCQRQQSSARQTADQDPVIAVVNQQEIRKASFENFLKRREVESSDARAQAPRQALFREFLIDQLLLQEARKSGVTVADEEVEAAFGALPAGPDTAKKEDILSYLLVQKFLGERIKLAETVSAEEMQRYYTDHQAEFVVDDRARVLEILVGDEKQAQQIRARLRPRDFRIFRQIARQSSKGLTADKGGDLGIFEPGQLPGEFEKVVFALKPGEISQVFRSEHGYHVFMVEEFIPRHALSFKEAEKTIFEKLLGQAERKALDDYVSELIEAASIKILDPTLAFDWRKDNADTD